MIRRLVKVYFALSYGIETFLPPTKNRDRRIGSFDEHDCLSFFSFSKDELNKIVLLFDFVDVMKYKGIVLLAKKCCCVVYTKCETGATNTPHLPLYLVVIKRDNHAHLVCSLIIFTIILTTLLLIT